MSPTFNEGCGPLVSGVEYDTILPADTQALVILLVSLPHAIFPSETLPVIPVVTFKAADVEASVEPIEPAVNTFTLVAVNSVTLLAVKLLTLPVRVIVPIFEEVEIELILNELSIVVTLNLVILLLSYILTLSIVDVSSNIKVNDLGGGSRIILVELAFSIVPASNTEIVFGVLIVSISKELLISPIYSAAYSTFGSLS